MLEAGISLVATNLPSLNFLVSKQSLQSFAASIRSAVSLGSMQSQRSKTGTDDRTPYSKMQQNGSMASDVPVMRRVGESGEVTRGVDTFAMYDMKDMEEVREPGTAHVTSETKQQGSMV